MTWRSRLAPRTPSTTEDGACVMKAQRPRRGKRDHDDLRPDKLLSARSALVITLGLLVGVSAGGLLWMGRQPLPLAVLGALTATAGGITFFNRAIE